MANNRTKQGFPIPTGSIAWCEDHQKLLYFTRKEARRAARRHPEHKTPYRCSVLTGLWHVGALHPLVIAGEKTKDQIRNRPEERRLAGLKD
jgi:hypothetical protein